MTTDPKVLHKYAAGYSQCANEVARYLAKMEGFNPEVKNRLANHLSNSLNKLSTAIPAVGPSASSPLPLQLGQGQQPLGLQMAASGGIVVPQSQSGELQLGQLASAVMSSMAASASASTSAESSSSTPAFPQLTQGSTPQNIFVSPGLIADTSQQQQQQQPQQQQQLQSQQQQTAHAQAQGVPVLPVQLIPAKLPSGDLVFLMTNQSMPVTNVMAPMSIQIPGATSAPVTPSTLVSPIPAAQGTPSVPGAVGNPPISILGQLPSSSVVTPSTSVAIVPPQVQDPKPSTSSALPDSPSDSYKNKQMFPMFSFTQDKPLDLAPSTSGLVKQERTDLFGAKPRAAPTATVTSSSASESILSRDRNSSSETSPRQENYPALHPQEQNHGQGHMAAPQQVAAAAANQVLPLPQGNILNLHHDNMWRPW